MAGFSHGWADRVIRVSPATIDVFITEFPILRVSGLTHTDIVDVPSSSDAIVSVREKAKLDDELHVLK